MSEVHQMKHNGIGHIRLSASVISGITQRLSVIFNTGPVGLI